MSGTGASQIQSIPKLSPWKRARRAASRLTLRWRHGLVDQRRADRVVIERIADRSIVVLPSVFNPRVFRSGAFFAESLDATLVPDGSSVLDLGTGSGILGIVAAQWASKVIAIDLNPESVRCARANALLNHCDARIDVRHGDLFAPVENEKFDVVLFNPPFYRGVPRSDADSAWRSTDVVERFARELPDHLLVNSRALVVLSTDGDTDSFLRSFGRAGLLVSRIAERVYPNETFTIYALAASD